MKDDKNKCQQLQTMWYRRTHVHSIQLNLETLA